MRNWERHPAWTGDPADCPGGPGFYDEQGSWCSECWTLVVPAAQVRDLDEKIATQERDNA